MEHSTMTTHIYTLNLTSLKFGLIGVAPFTFGQYIKLTDLEQLQEETGAAVVYIVGHAIPNGLRDAKDNTMSEEQIARQLDARKGKTLVIFDVCFAGALEEIEGFRWPDDRIGRIYSCKSYERTWNGDPNHQSLFSVELNRALPDYVKRDSFDGLDKTLQAAFGGLQTPEVRVSEPLRPSTFFR
jgi:hypothetical protein